MVKFPQKKIKKIGFMLIHEKVALKTTANIDSD